MRIGRMRISKKAWIPLLVVASALVIFGIVILSLRFTVWKKTVNMTAAQATAGGSDSVSVTWDPSNEIEAVTVSTEYKGRTISSIHLTDPTVLAAGAYEINTVYGRQNVSVSIHYKGGFLNITETETKTVDVFANEYVIAPLVGTMPVTMFSLELKNITNDYTIPTYVWFARSGAWDYSKLPDNVNTVPVASYAEIIGNTDGTEILERTSEWIKELYEMNSDSIFHLYYNDWHSWGMLDATVGNGIPEANYDVVLLSDGTASFTGFNRHFNNSDDSINTAEYNSMVDKYTTLKEEVAEKGKYTRFGGNYTIQGNMLSDYAYIMANEESNITWWLSRINGTMATNNATMKTSILNNTSLVRKELKGLFEGLSPEEQVNIKTLFNFGNALFEKADVEHKTPMIILGSHTSTENASNFEEYCKAIVAYYGTEDYVFYYKGHPNNPTDTEPGKLEKLESWGLIDVDSTIPAELFFFFYPNCVGTGFQSSTFTSLTDAQSASVIGITKGAMSQAYKPNLEEFFSVADSSAAYGELLVEGHSTILIEFTDTTSYDIGLYDSVDNTIRYYKIVESVYTLV